MPETPAGGTEPRPGTRRWSSRRVEVHDESMLPGLRPGDRLLVDRRAFRDRLPRSGEIVVLEDPEEPSRWLVKRVAAVGPDPVPRDPGAHDPDLTSSTPPLVPRGTVFVLSDAAVPTRDSRQFGPVRIDRLIGRVYRRYAPADRRGDL
jgi:signal peptidase I